MYGEVRTRLVNEWDSCHVLQVFDDVHDGCPQRSWWPGEEESITFVFVGMRLGNALCWLS